MRDEKIDFESQIEKFAVGDAVKFYLTKKVSTDSSMRCEASAKHHGRDAEEAKLIYACLFPFAYHYIGEIENTKRNAA